MMRDVEYILKYFPGLRAPREGSKYNSNKGAFRSDVDVYVIGIG